MALKELMTIGIDISPLKSGHKVRGVGAYVSLIKNNIEKYDKVNEYIFFENKVPSGIDLVHYPYFDPFFPTLPLRKELKAIVTVHDLTPIKFKKNFPVGIKGYLRWKYNEVLLKKIDRVVVDSKSSKKDVVKIIGLDENKVSVVYLGANPIYKKIEISLNKKKEISEKYGLDNDSFIYVGDVTWNKNLPRIIKAAIKSDVSLFLIGKAITEKNFDTSNPWNKDRIEVQKLITENPKIKALGFVPDEDLSIIYNLATSLLMPSLYEGFGLPVLEAMQCGCPVITSREGSLPEVGGDAVIYADPLSVDSISAEIDKLKKNIKLRKELSEKGLEQATKFSVEKMMIELVNVYKTS